MARLTWELEENPKNRRWYLAIPEGLEIDAYPSIEAVRERAASQGIDPNILLGEAALEKSLGKARAMPGEEFTFPIALEPTFDVRLIISPDKTKASLYIRKASDRHHTMDMKLISTVINNGRLKGLDPQKIRETINEFRDSQAMELMDFVIAEGVPPGRGKDRTLTRIVEWLPETEAKVLRDRLVETSLTGRPTPSDKAFPLAEASSLAIVERGQLLYEISPVETGPTGIDVYGKSIPGLPGNDPFVQIIDSVTLGPYGFRADVPGVLLASEINGGVRLRIINSKDAAATVILSQDNMTASVVLEDSEGSGSPLTVELALKALSDKGVKGQIDTGRIQEGIEEAKATKTRVEVVVLRGETAVLPGTSRITRFIAPSGPGESGNILAGDRILTIKKLPAGADGRDVLGNEIKSATARPETEPEHDDTIGTEALEGELAFVARVSGELTFSNGKYSISDTKEIIANVDDKTGDLSFPANLILTGSVDKGRTVKAGGSLTINGTAGASLVYSDLSVTMNGGIKGAGQGTVWAKQTIRLSFAENARILAGGDIFVDKYCFQCTVKTNGMLIMKGNPAVLMGGTVRASRGVEVFELGSERPLRTSISFGQNYLISDQIEVCEKEVLRIKETVEKIDAAMVQTSNTNPRIHEYRQKKLELLKRNDKLTVRIFTLKEQYETHIISHVRVENTVYPGVILESHGRYYEVRERRNHVIFIFDQKTGQITCNPIQDTDKNQE